MTDNASTPTECVVGSIETTHAHELFYFNACPSTEACTDTKPLTEEHERQLVTIQDHGTLAPIKRLHPEILSEIFEHCLDAESCGVFSAVARSKEAPLLLGRVCSSWRAIAHATPRLWRDIVLNVCDGLYSDELRRDALPVLQKWLAHSGSLPLSLVVLCKAQRVLPGLVDLFETIAAHAARWKTVHVRLQHSPVIYMLVCRAFTKCSALSTFDVTDDGQYTLFFGDQQPDEVEPVCFDLSVAPLHQLSLSLAGLSIRDVHAPWAMLTRLSFMQDARSSTSSITDYVAILQQCRSLKECGITIDSGVRDAPLEPFTLPSLESLQLQVLRDASRTTQTGDFLGALSAPRLRALSIEDYCPRSEAVLYHSQLRAFLQAHAPSLRTLRLLTSSKHFTSEDMVALIVETPLLTELEYHADEEPSPRALLERLTPRVQGDVLECLLPCLEKFFVYWDTAETVSMVGDMVEQRYPLVERGIARLQHLSCKPVMLSMDQRVVVEDLAARLEPLCRRGLEVDWEAYI